MKQALCVKDINDIVKGIDDKNHLIETSFVSRAICENPENGYLQIIPYVTFYTVDELTGRVKFVIYKRANQINEERLKERTSIGFGGHIDTIDDIAGADFVTKSEGTQVCYMNLEDFNNSVLKAAKREVREELGEHAANLISDDVNSHAFLFFKGDENEEVNKVHFGVNIPIALTQEQYLELFKLATVEPEEIESLNELSINLGLMIQEFNLGYTINKVAKGLKESHNLEDWSTIVLENICQNVASDFIKDISYADLVYLKAKKLEYEKAKKANEDEDGFVEFTEEDLVS